MISRLAWLTSLDLSAGSTSIEYGSMHVLRCRSLGVTPAMKERVMNETVYPTYST